MITLEEQLHRYAVDVAGPAVGDPPSDLDQVSRPRSRGRWLLVAALVVFTAGLTYVATRPTELGDAPTADTVMHQPPPPASWASDIGQCVDEPASEIWTGPTQVSGIRLAGPAGNGLCIGLEDLSEDTFPWSDPAIDGTTVWLTGDGHALMPILITRCSGSGGGSGVAVDDRLAYVTVVDASVRTVVFGGAEGTLSAATFEVPGNHGKRLGVIWLPDAGQHHGVSALLTADGERYQLPPDQQETGLPPDCPTSTP